MLAFRKGAPFLRSVDTVVQRLLETGLVNHWLRQLIEESARDARMKNSDNNKAVDKSQGVNEVSQSEGSTIPTWWSNLVVTGVEVG